MNNNTNTNITIDGRNLCRTSTLWNNIRQSATTINELTESMSKDFRKPETYEGFTSMNRDVKKILQTAITLKRNMDVITGRLEAAMILRDANKAAAGRILSDREDDIAKEEPVKAPESPQNAPEGVETAYTAKMEETPAKPVVEPPKVKTPVFRFIPTVCDTNNFDVLTLDGFSTMPYAVGVRVTGEDEMPFQYGLLAAAIKKVIDTLNDVMTPAATLNPFPAKPEDFINGVYCGFKNVKFTIINADWVPGGATAVAVTIEHENGGFSCTTGRNVVVHVDLRKDVLEHGLKALAEGANKLLMAVSKQAK